MKKNIVLVGFMGTGKSAVGKRLAEKLKKKYLDTDEMVQQVAGISIEKIFSKFGEVRFRSEERLAVNRASSYQNVIIATGGGAILDDENMRDLKKNGIVICLKARPEVIQERIGRRDNRPLLKKDKSLEHIRELLKEREKFYAKADHGIDTSEMEIEEIVEAVLEYVKGREKKGE